MTEKGTLTKNEETLAPGLDGKVIKRPFEEPKLKFIEPELVKHGDATKLTKQGFFGTFNPEDQ